MLPSPPPRLFPSLEHSSAPQAASSAISGSSLIPKQTIELHTAVTDLPIASPSRSLYEFPSRLNMATNPGV